MLNVFQLQNAQYASVVSTSIKPKKSVLSVTRTVAPVSVQIRLNVIVARNKAPNSLKTTPVRVNVL